MPSLASRLTALIKTFERPECCARAVASIRQFYPDLHIIVADDSARLSHPAPWDTNLSLLPLPFDSGLSEGRNALVAEATTELIWLLDDDFVVDERTDIRKLVAAIDAGLDIAAMEVDGIIGYKGTFLKDGDTLRRVPMAKGTHAGYPLYDYVVNAWVGRTASVIDVPWDPVLKLGEHADWSWRSRHLMKTVVDDVAIGHLQERSDRYRSFRNRAKHFGRVWMEMAGWTRVVGAAGETIDATDGTTAPEPPKASAGPRRKPAGVAFAWPTGPQPAPRSTMPSYETPKTEARSVAVMPIETSVAPPQAPQVSATPRFERRSVSRSPDPIPSHLRALYGARVLVVGSAPGAILPAPSTYDRIVVANGGIANVPRKCTVDVALLTTWTLGTTSPVRMAVIEQYRGRHVPVLVIHGGGWNATHDPTVPTWTPDPMQPARRDAFADVHTTYDAAYGVTPTGRERWIGSACGGLVPRGQTEGWGTAGWSSGVLAAALAWYCGASSVCLAGMSFQPGYVYGPDTAPRRAHSEGDQAVLREAAKRHPWWTTAPELIACGVPDRLRGAHGTR